MSHAVSVPSSESLYDEDLVLWAAQQAHLLQDGRYRDLDLENLIDEVEGVGHSQRDAIESRLTILLAHLLKWRYQPGMRSGSWRGTIFEQRRGIAGLIRTSPSLRAYPEEVFADCYLSGRLLAAKETGIDLTLFPEQAPFQPIETLDQDYLPPEPDLEGSSS